MRLVSPECSFPGLLEHFDGPRVEADDDARCGRDGRVGHRSAAERGPHQKIKPLLQKQVRPNTAKRSLTEKLFPIYLRVGTNLYLIFAA